MFPWSFGQPKQLQTPRQLLLERLSEGVPPELACRAAGIAWDDIKDDPEIDKALAEGEILLFTRTRDAGVTGTIRAAMRRESQSWNVKAEAPTGMTLEDYLK